MTKVFFSDNCLSTLRYIHPVECACMPAALNRSVVSNSATPWTAAHQAPLSVGFFQARVLEWVAISYSRGSSWPRDGTCISCLAGGFFTTEPPGKPMILLSNNKEQSIDTCNNLHGSQGYYGEWKKSQKLHAYDLYNILKNLCGILKVKKENWRERTS